MTTVLILVVVAMGASTILTVWRAIAISRFERSLRRVRAEETPMSGRPVLRLVGPETVNPVRRNI
jgi:hypothetical protein